MQSLVLVEKNFLIKAFFSSIQCNELFLVCSNDKAVVAIAPGSVWGTKRWPAEKFEELTHLILAHLDCNIVFLELLEKKNLLKR